MKFVRTAMSVMAALMLFPCSAAVAQYPDHVVRIINPYATGGSVDALTRLFATRLSERTGKRFIVENKTGAGGRIGYDFAAKSKGDGYTLVAADPAGYAVLGALYPKLPWDHANDLIPVTVFARAPFAIVVGPQSKFKTLGELLDYSRANPGKVTYGSPGLGTPAQLMMEYLQLQANVTWTHVPYKGGSEALLGVMSDNIDVMSTGVSTILGHVKKGSVNVLALTSQARWPGADQVPTLTEQGVNIVTLFVVRHHGAEGHAGGSRGLSLPAGCRVGRRTGDESVPGRAGRARYCNATGRYRPHGSRRNATLDSYRPHGEHQSGMTPRLGSRTGGHRSERSATRRNATAWAAHAVRARFSAR